MELAVKRRSSGSTFPSAEASQALAAAYDAFVSADVRPDEADALPDERPNIESVQELSDQHRVISLLTCNAPLCREAHVRPYRSTG
jgi:hypothetical protein